MRNIKQLTVGENYHLLIRFENGIEKNFDVAPFLNYPVFQPLKDLKAFSKVVNKGYFIEWTDYDVDLSADTLWHSGVETASK